MQNNIDLLIGSCARAFLECGLASEEGFTDVLIKNYDLLVTVQHKVKLPSLLESSPRI